MAMLSHYCPKKFFLLLLSLLTGCKISPKKHPLAPIFIEFAIINHKLQLGKKPLGGYN
jgi:hypothetical protein